MVSSSLDLIEEILHLHFGPLASEVGRALAARPGCTLPEITRTIKTPTPLTRVRNVVTILIQHNCVIAEPIAPVKGDDNEQAAAAAVAAASGRAKYSLDCSEVLMRTRYSQFALLVEKNFGMMARVVLFQVLQYGRLAMSATVDFALADLASGFDVADCIASPDSQSKKSRTGASRSPQTRKQVESELAKLVSSNILERVERYDKVGDECKSGDKQETVNSKGTSSSSSGTLGMNASTSTATEDKALEAFLGRVGGYSTDTVSDITVDAATRAASSNKTTDSIQMETPDDSSTPVAPKRGRGRAAKTAAKTAAAPKKRQSTGTVTDTAGTDTTGKTKKRRKAGTDSDVEVPLDVFADNDVPNAPVSAGTDAVDEAANPEVVDGMGTGAGPVDDSTKYEFVYRVNSAHLSVDIAKEMVEVLIAGRFSDFVLVKLSVRCLLQAVRLVSGTVISGMVAFPDILRYVVEQQGGSSHTKVKQNTLLRVLDELSRHNDKIVRIVRKDADSGYEIDWPQARNVLSRGVTFSFLKARCTAEAARVWSSMVILNPGQYWDEHQLAEASLLPIQQTRSVLYTLKRCGFVRSQTADISTSKATGDSTRSHNLIYAADANNCRRQVLTNLYEIYLRMWTRKKKESDRVNKLLQRAGVLLKEEQDELLMRELGEDILELQLLQLDLSILILRDFCKTD